MTPFERLYCFCCFRLSLFVEVIEVMGIVFQHLSTSRKEFL